MARILLDAGFSVVLCGTDGDELGRAAASLRAVGRVGVLVGDPDLAAAVIMAAELFGTQPVVVRSVDEAVSITDSGQNIGSPMGYRE